MQCCFEHNADDYFKSLDSALDALDILGALDILEK